MKNLFLISTALFFCITANAQVSKGMSMISGIASYNQHLATNDYSYSTEIREIKNSGLEIGPRYGYMLTNHVMIGIAVSYNSSSISSSNKVQFSNSFASETTLTKSSGYSAGVFSRYYQSIGKSRLAAFVQLNASYGRDKGTITITNVNTSNLTKTNINTDGTSFGVNANIGLTYFLNNRLAFETTFGRIGYDESNSGNYYTQSASSDTRQKNAGFNAIFNSSTLLFGISFYFGGTHAEATPTRQ